MENSRIEATETQNETSTIKKVLNGLKDYLTDWKNLLGHALLGVGLLVIAIWAPIVWWIKVIIFVCLVTVNIFRMKRKKLNSNYKKVI